MARKIAFSGGWVPAAKTIRNNEIVAKRIGGYTMRQLAVEYSVSEQCIYQIIRRSKLRAVWKAKRPF